MESQIFKQSFGEKNKNNLDVLVSSAIKEITLIESGLDCLKRDEEKGFLEQSGLRLIKDKGGKRGYYVIMADNLNDETYKLAQEIAKNIPSRNIRIDQKFKE
jgi:hypothetical protein